MDFGDGTFSIRVMNTNKVVHNSVELLDAAGEFLQG